jgi:hypothetical protein
LGGSQPCGRARLKRKWGDTSSRGRSEETVPFASSCSPRPPRPQRSAARGGRPRAYRRYAAPPGGCTPATSHIHTGMKRRDQHNNNNNSSNGRQGSKTRHWRERERWDSRGTGDVSCTWSWAPGGHARAHIWLACCSLHECVRDIRVSGTCNVRGRQWLDLSRLGSRRPHVRFCECPLLGRAQRLQHGMRGRQPLYQDVRRFHQSRVATTTSSSAGAGGG